VLAVVLAAGAIYQLRPANSVPPAATSVVFSGKAGLPSLIDLGSDKCIPCKAMQPVLASLRSKYKDKLNVDFIDVWEDEAAGAKYDVKSIPTQVFLDGKGKEVYRHTGFFSVSEIEAKMNELGLIR
jgi:thioredoxin 1